MRESDFVTRCTRCTGFGHEESSRPSDTAVMSMELPVSEEDSALEIQPFAATEAGKCSATIDDRVGVRRWTSRSCSTLLIARQHAT